MEPIIIPRLPLGKNNTWKTIAGHRIRVKGLDAMKKGRAHQYARYRDGWEYDIRAALGRQGIHSLERQKTPRRVTIVQYRPRLLDEDNLETSIGPILDALKRCGLIWDDSPKWIEQEIYQHRAEQPRTEIRVEDTLEVLAPEKVPQDAY